MMDESSLKYKTGFRRLGAAIIDGFVFMPLGFIDDSIMSNLDHNAGLLLWLFFMAGLRVIYPVFMHYRYGQTIGKMVAKVKVVNLDETRTLTLSQSFQREIFYVVIESLTLLYLAFNLLQPSSQTNGLFEIYSAFELSLIGFWTLLELLSMLTNEKRRAVHDFIAGSVVIRTDVGDIQKIANE